MDHEDVEILEVRELLLQLFLAFIVAIILLEDNEIEVLMHEVAFLVHHKVMVLIGPHDLLVVLLLAPLIEVEDEVNREVRCTPIELLLEVDGKAATLEDQTVATSHAVNQGLAKGLNRICLLGLLSCYANCKLVYFNEVSLVAEKNFTIPGGVENQLIVLSLLETLLALDVQLCQLDRLFS